MEYYAHSPKDGRPAQTYVAHVKNVMHHAERYAREVCPYGSLDGDALVELTGTAAFWHDLGKLDGENQTVLSGEKSARVLPKKHWDAGAALLCEQNAPAAIAVYSHHIGYPDFSTEINRGEHAFRVEGQMAETDKLLRKYTVIHESLLGARESATTNVILKGDKSEFFRLLLSCLADADHGDTAEHYGNAPVNQPAPALRPVERLKKMNEYVASLSAGCDVVDERVSLRNEMYARCRDVEIKDNVKISACDSPVGSGKTTAVMAHLLEQARQRGLRRIFVVLPFTNIIQQSVDVYRAALTLPGENPEDVVAELHHRADFESEEARRFTALWRAPIVVTTAVAFFETLASSSPAALRRLHELPGSAIFVDEAHAALPAKLLPVAWKWMNVYAEEWGCYWVLASGSLCRFWQIPEIVQNTTVRTVPEIVGDDLRQRLGAYEGERIHYQSDLTPRSIDSVIEWIRAFPGPRLVIVNTVNNAAVLAAAYNKRFGRGCIEHLSTALTSLDRGKTLARVKSRLSNLNDTDWALIATSCVEAGVDLSFHTGFRELGSLASLLQASGRVNRGGESEDAEVWTFVLDSSDSDSINKNPSLEYSAGILRDYFLHGVAVSQELCTDAIADEIKLRGVDSLYKELLKSEGNYGFETVEHGFKVIDGDTRLAVVDPDVAKQIQDGKIGWRELQKNSIQIRSYKLQEFKIPEILDGIYLWDLGYDGFLGFMAGILAQNDVKNFIL